MDKKIIKKVIYTNSPKYKVDDSDTQNLALKAVLYDITKILIGPTSVPIVSPIIEGKNIDLGVTVSYPSGAYFPEAKAEEIAELREQYPQIDSFYMVTAVGRFLSGYDDEAIEELRVAKNAAKDKKVFAVTEASVLNDEQMKKLCDMAVEAGIDGIVDTTGFAPYNVPFPTIEETKRLIKAAQNRIPIISGYNENFEDAREKLKAGVRDAVILNIDELI